MNDLSNHRRDWEALGAFDPLLTTLRDVDGRHGTWTLDTFLASGERDAGRLLAAADRLGLATRRDHAFELGCGAGRITRALATQFAHCTGVDISSTMITRAQELNADRTNCTWLVHDGPELKRFPPGAYDLVLSHLVLQHVPTQSAILLYIVGLTRMLADGGLLAVQLPATMPLRQRVQPRRRLYGALRRVGVQDEVLYNRFGLHPIRMNWVPRSLVEQAITAAGGRVVEVLPGWLGDHTSSGREVNLTYLATREEPSEAR